MKTKRSPWLNIFIGSVVAAVVVVAVAGLWISGSPAQERARRLDGRRLSDLMSISNSIDQYYNTNNKTLPPDLDTLSRSRDVYYFVAKDPETGLPYEYLVMSADTYQLCANFVTDTRGQDPSKREPYYEGQGNRFWEHGPERTCFTITARAWPSPR